MLKRISLKKLTQKVEESKVVSSATKSTLVAKGVIIGENRPRDKVPYILSSEAGSKGKEAMPPLEARKKAKSMVTPNAAAIMGAIHSVATKESTSTNPVAALGPRAIILRSSATEEKLLEAVIPPSDKEEVENWILIGWSISSFTSLAR